MQTVLTNRHSLMQKVHISYCSLIWRIHTNCRSLMQIIRINHRSLMRAVHTNYRSLIQRVHTNCRSSLRIVHVNRRSLMRRKHTNHRSQMQRMYTNQHQWMLASLICNWLIDLTLKDALYYLLLKWTYLFPSYNL